MKHLFTASAIAVLLMAGSAAAHDPEDVNRDVVADFDFKDFDSIKIEGVYLLDIRQGNTFSIRTEATEDEAEWQEVTLKGRTLVLGSRKSGWKKNNNSHGVQATITLPRLVDLDVTGVATGVVSAFAGGNVDVDIAGVSDLTLSGICDRLDIDLAGVGDVNAEDLVCDDVDADMGGVGSISVYAAKSIDADAGGIGSIEVYGNPDQRSVDDGFMAKVKFR
jgi:hypothetical protein